MRQLLQYFMDLINAPEDAPLQRLKAIKARKNPYLGLTEVQQSFVMMRLAGRSQHDIAIAFGINMRTLEAVEAKVLKVLEKQ